MKRYFLLLVVMVSLAGFGQSLDGSWKSKLQAGPQELTLLLRIHQSKKLVELDVLEQGAKNIPMAVTYLSADSLNASVPTIGLNIAGRLVDGKIETTFRQMAFTAPLTFERGEIVVNRPQEPGFPLPYRTEEVKFSNPDGAATLAGTLCYPVGYKAGKKVPVVLMVTGSGGQNRDEELFGHKYFLVIADWLARNGIASLRYDDRGVGQSTGDFKTSTTADFAQDAAAGLDFLRRTKAFSKVGLLGHSEGGAVAYMLGAKNLTDFIVSLAGPAGRIDELMMAQLNGMARAQGANTDVVKTPEEARNTLLAQQNNAWMQYFVAMNLTEAVKKTHCPVFALGGEKDLNVPVSVNNTVLRDNLPATKGNKIKVYPGLGHTFQPSKSGLMTECFALEETISQEVLKDISDWIHSVL